MSEEEVHRHEKGRSGGYFPKIQLEMDFDENPSATTPENSTKKEETEPNQGESHPKIEVNSETKLVSTKNLPQVPKELFEKMVDNSNTSIAE